MGDLFEHFRSSFAEPFSRWVDRNLAAVSMSRSVFYPMSGPDAVFPLLLGRDAEQFVLCGLEPCGSPQSLSRLTTGQMTSLLPRAAQAADHFLKHGYFVTSDMRRDLDDVDAPGVLPILLMLLVRSGADIRSAVPCTLGQAGIPAAESSSDGICITFKHRDRMKRLLYFRRDLRDCVFSQADPLHTLVSDMSAPLVLLKSASYLLHEPNFTTIAALILERSATIVQDPSSLPLRSLRQGGWHIDLHGRYSGAPAIFAKYEQLDLIDAYIETKGPRLEFGFSYLRRPEIASLMVATPRRCEGPGAAWGAIATSTVPLSGAPIAHQPSD